MTTRYYRQDEHSPWVRTEQRPPEAQVASSSSSPFEKYSQMLFAASWTRIQEIRRLYLLDIEEEDTEV